MLDGAPQGVVVPHRNVLALLEATAEDFGLDSDDTWTLFHSSAFDFSVWEIWGCLLSVDRLVVVPCWATRDPEEFQELLADHRVTVLNQTPSAFSQLVWTDLWAPRELAALRLIVFGGEPLDVRMLAPWFAQHSHTRCRVVNMFGITETPVHVTAQTLTPVDVAAGSRSVGRALPGWSLSVRDQRGRLLPSGPVGEIWVGGAGVAGHYAPAPAAAAAAIAQIGAWVREKTKRPSCAPSPPTSWTRAPMPWSSTPRGSPTCGRWTPLPATARGRRLKRAHEPLALWQREGAVREEGAAAGRLALCVR